MARYIVSRLFQMMLVFVCVTSIVFLMLHLAPGDPLTTILGTKYGRVSEETRADLRHNLGLDLPLPVQYLRWLGKAIQGDLGRSMVMRQEVFPLLMERLCATAILAAGALLLAAPLGVFAGVASAIRRNSIGDRIISAFATMGICTPAFFLGMVLIIAFALRLGWLPTSGMHSVGQEGVVDLLRHLLLPAVCLGAPAAAVIARMTRSSMLEVMAEPYVVTGRAKGLKERVVIWRHAFRNALVPIVTVVGLELGAMLGGAVLVEVVFSWPGIGLLLWEGVLKRDFPVVQGAVLIVASSYVFINFFVDTLYAYIDPRIRLTN